jgi:hypothetical protein
MSYTNKREDLNFALIMIGGMCAIALTLYIALKFTPTTVRYDCSISEISPDVPIKAREQCRELRAQNNLQKPK